MGWWFKDAHETVQKFHKQSLECKKNEDPFDQLNCMMKLTFSLKLEIDRLIEALPEVILSLLFSSSEIHELSFTGQETSCH